MPLYVPGTASIRATVDFGAVPETQEVTVTVAAPWVTAAMNLVAVPFAGTTADHDPDDLAAEGVVAYVANVIPGVSFDLHAVAADTTWGKYLVNVLGA